MVGHVHGVGPAMNAAIVPYQSDLSAVCCHEGSWWLMEIYFHDRLCIWMLPINIFALTPLLVLLGM
jgi:hypothetical protein